MAANESIFSGAVALLTSTNFQAQPIKKFTVRLKNTVKSARNTSKSFVWDYFGDLLCSNVHCDRDRNYCSLCLEKAKQDAGPTATLDSFNVKKYQTNVSTSNYAWHLNRHHGVNDVTRALAKIKPETQTKTEKKMRPYNRRSQQRYTDTEETRPPPTDIEALLTGGGGDAITVLVQKEPAIAAELTNAIAVWFARDILPLDNANGAGFKDFMQRFNVDEDAIAAPSQLKADILDIHTVLLGHVRHTLAKAAPSCGCVTFGKWNDTVGRYSYTSFTYHFVSQDFRFEHVCLRVVSSLSPLSADNLAQELQRTAQQFGIEKKLFATRDDRDGAVEAACRDIDVRSVSCIGCIFDRLIVTDGTNADVKLRDLLAKSYLVASTLNLGAESLMTAIPEQFYHEALLEIGQLEDIFTAEGLVAPSGNRTADGVPIPSSDRWTVTLKLLQTLIKHKHVINVLLEQLQNVGDIALDEDEWESLEGVHAFVSTFGEAVDILSNCCYPTLNLVLLFRSHLLLQLADKKNDHPYVVRLKSLIRASFDEHFPVEHEAVLAALLDPRLRDLTIVNEYLASIEQEKAQFLSSAIWKHEIVVVESVAAASSSCATQLGTNDGSSSTAKRQRLSINELAKQHSCTHSGSDGTDSIRDEINGLLAHSPESVLDDDILAFWNRKQEDWPVLSALARVVFCVPATCAPVSALFQTDGLLRTSRFCSLNPAIVDKAVFVAQNYPYFVKGTIR